MLKVGGRSGIMHAIKGGWVGQTFALSKRHESGGRKYSRLSKEERKERAESFIKKYQSLNNGNFPSLNLTHKEVGGSFYTIRQIVREIIQENRVLGPAKSLPEEQKADKLFAGDPSGTIFTEPEDSPFMLPNGSAFLSVQHQDTSEDEPYYLISKGLHQGLDNGKSIDVSHAFLTNKDHDDIKAAINQVGEPLERKKSKEETAVSTSKVAQMEDVTVETFPLQPVNEPTYYLDGNSSAVGSLNGTIIEKDVKLPLGPVYEASSSNGMNFSSNSSLVDDKVENLADPLLETGSRLVDDKVENLADPLLETGSRLVDDKVENLADPLLETESRLVDNKVENLADPLLETESRVVDDKVGNLADPLLEGKSRLEDDKIENLADALLEGKSRLADEKAMKNIADLQPGNSNSLTTKNCSLHDTQVDINAEVKLSQNEMKSAETKVVNVANGPQIKIPNGTQGNTNGSMSITQPKVLQNKADSQHSGSSQEGIPPTLKRINIESWEGVSKKPAKQETNPVIAVLKSFVASFAKFWSG